MEILLAVELLYFMVAVGMDATGAHGCKVKNLRNQRFVLRLKRSREGGAFR